MFSGFFPKWRCGGVSDTRPAGRTRRACRTEQVLFGYITGYADIEREARACISLFTWFRSAGIVRRSEARRRGVFSYGISFIGNQQGVAYDQPWYMTRKT